MIYMIRKGKYQSFNIVSIFLTEHIFIIPIIFSLHSKHIIAQSFFHTRISYSLLLCRTTLFYLCSQFSKLGCETLVWRKIGLTTACQLCRAWYCPENIWGKITQLFTLSCKVKFQFFCIWDPSPPPDIGKISGGFWFLVLVLFLAN